LDHGGTDEEDHTSLLSHEGLQAGSASGQFQTIKVDRSLYINRESLESWLESQQRPDRQEVTAMD
jgi:hypothetical protein